VQDSSEFYMPWISSVYSFMTGQPCDLHLFDSDYQIGSNHKHEDETSLNDIFDDTMTVWEDIYLNLYSMRAVSASRDARARQMRLVADSMDRFAQHHAQVMSSSSTSKSEKTNLKQTEIAYGYYVSQVLILRCELANEQSQNKMLEAARALG
jgi:hypothetical protein